MNQNKVIQYLDRVIAGLCAWYLYRFHIVPRLPGYRLAKRLKRVGFFIAGGGEDQDGQAAGVDGGATLYIDPDRPQFHNEVFARWLVHEHVKAMADPEEIETIHIVFGNPVAQ